jgi:hypothetical protein
MDTREEMHRTRYRDDSVVNLIAEQTRQGEMPEVVPPHVTPALFTSTSTDSTESANARTLARWARSSCATSMSPDRSVAARCAYSMLRQAITTLSPPVTITRISAVRT